MEGPKLNNAKASAPGSPSTNEKTSKSSAKHPSPLDLDRFIPWMFMELQSTQTVIVKRLYQEEYPRRHAGRKNISRTSFTSKHTSSRLSMSHKADSHNTDNSTALHTTTIQLTTYYNRAGHLVEIAIDDCPFPINRKLIETISVCLPFHNMLNKLTCKGKGVDCDVIDEIEKMMPLSHLTEICLDNTFVPQGNYYILLDQASTLKCLSLSKCRINDVVCKKIAEHLEFDRPASKNLLFLSLSCNFISDIGAQALGHSLRTNRHILHLNLCGNSITSVGAGHLLEPLSEFLLVADEVTERSRNRREYYKRKAAFVSMNVSPNENTTDLRNTTENNYKMRGSLKKNSQFESTHTDVSTKLDEKMSEDYIFDLSNTVFKNDCWYATGNLVLCSLNLGYNNLDYTSLPKIVDVLSYQKDQERSKGFTGLLRIVIEGNNLPDNCEEYSKINMYLELLKKEALSLKNKREPSISRKARRSTVHLMTPQKTDGDSNSPDALSSVSAQ